MGMVTLKIEITSEEAEAYAQVLKRTAISDYTEKATSQDEAQSAYWAGIKIRVALANKGFSPA